MVLDLFQIFLLAGLLGGMIAGAQTANRNEILMWWFICAAVFSTIYLMGLLFMKTIAEKRQHQNTDPDPDAD